MGEAARQLSRAEAMIAGQRGSAERRMEVLAGELVESRERVPQPPVGLVFGRDVEV